MQVVGKKIVNLKKLIASIVLLGSSLTYAQCDFINDITGLTLTVMPSGDAGNAGLFTHEYVLVDSDGFIAGVNSSPDFLGLDAGQYYVYSVNYEISEAASLSTILAIGQPWSTATSFNGCLDISEPYSNCHVSVCDEITVMENSVVVNPASGYSSSGSNTETYFLVCDGVIQEMDASATFDLSTIGAAFPGADCQIIAINFPNEQGNPYSVGDSWSSQASANCNQESCWDYLARDLEIITVLGVDLLDFSGTPKERYNLLQWIVTDEVDNNHFVLLRSFDGIHFEEITTVQSIETDSENQTYEFEDFEIVPSISYYRLKSVDDFNGVEYSSIVALSRNGELTSNWNLFPNPLTEETTLSFTSAMKGQGNGEIITMDGKIALRFSFVIEQGPNKYNLNTLSLANGAYFLKVTSSINDTPEIIRIIK